MTKKRAEFIRWVRIEEGGIGNSWRGTARMCADKFGGEWGSNQLAGMELCKKAAIRLGENYMTPPWN